MKPPLSALLLFLLSSPFSSFAQQGSGNGGITVVCRNADLTIQTARLLDVLEGEQRDGYQYPFTTTAELDSRAMKKLGGSQNVNSMVGIVSGLRKQFPPMDTQFSLPDAQDFKPRIRLKDSHCRFETAALYDDRSNRLSVDQEIYQALPALEKDGLYWHEWIYKNARKFGQATNSDLARQLNAYLLSSSSSVVDPTLLVNPAAGNLLRFCGLIYDVDFREYLFVDGKLAPYDGEQRWAYFQTKKMEMKIGNYFLNLEFLEAQHEVHVTMRRPDRELINLEGYLDLAYSTESHYLRLNLGDGVIPKGGIAIGCHYESAL